MNIDDLKKQAAEYAVTFVKSGMVIGLGTGSTALFALKKIARLIKSGELKNIVGIPSSVQTELEAKKLNIPLSTLDEHPVIDLTIDGADEAAFGISENHNNSVSTGEVSQYNSSTKNKNLSIERCRTIYLIKGGGGALLREKILAQASKSVIIIIDESKRSEKLGTKWSLPVEVIPFAVNPEKIFLESINAKIKLRVNSKGEKLITDQGNIILDADFGEIKNPEELVYQLNNRAGIVEHGLFIGLSDYVIIAGNKGITEVRASKG